jgi:hypothetical protein
MSPKIAAQFKADIEDRLASLLSANAEADLGRRSTVLSPKMSWLGYVRLCAASQRMNFRHSTPGRVHVCILWFAEVNLLQTKEMVRMA